MSKKSKIMCLIATLIMAFSTVTAYIIGHDLGYSKAMDEYIGASECKPSRKWRQRF